MIRVSGDEPGAWDRATKFLHSFPALEKVTSLEFDACGPFQKRRVLKGLEGLDSLLEGGQFKELKTITICLRDAYSMYLKEQLEDMTGDEITETIWSALRRLQVQTVVHLRLCLTDLTDLRQLSRAIPSSSNSSFTSTQNVEAPTQSRALGTSSSISSSYTGGSSSVS